MPRSSVVIPVYNRAGLTKQCLDTLLSMEMAGSFETIVIDDASTDGTRELLNRYGSKIRVISHRDNRGFATACNDGAAVASGDYLVFLNNDTAPTSGWLDALVRYADATPHAAVVGSKLLFPNDTIQHAGVVVGQDRNPRHLYAGFPSAHPAVNKSRRFQIVTGACALVRRGPFEEIGAFDIAFRNGYEDVDLCLRLNERGNEVHYCHESVLYHLESVSQGRSLNEKKNHRLYRARWATTVKPDDLDYYVEDGLLTTSYPGTYPIELTVSPSLALMRTMGGEAEVDRLLRDRSQQVSMLLKEVVRLTVLATEAHAVTAWPAEPQMGAPFTFAQMSDDHAQLVRRDDEIAGAILDFQQHLAATAGSFSRASSWHANDGQRFTPSPSLGYWHLVERVRQTVISLLPGSATVIVITEGDDAFLKLESRQAWHFPQLENGTYAGSRPADSATAIAHLEDLRARGAEFLIVPSVALWWLDYYTGFKEHLEREYRVVHSDENTCIAFCLRPRSSLSTSATTAHAQFA